MDIPRSQVLALGSSRDRGTVQSPMQATLACKDALAYMFRSVHYGCDDAGWKEACLFRLLQ